LIFDYSPCGQHRIRPKLCDFLTWLSHLRRGGFGVRFKHDWLLFGNSRIA
jgi:hypothetical protein